MAKVIVEIDGVKHRLVSEPCEEVIHCNYCSLYAKCNPYGKLLLGNDSRLCQILGVNTDSYFTTKENRE